MLLIFSFDLDSGSVALSWLSKFFLPFLLRNWSKNVKKRTTDDVKVIEILTLFPTSMIPWGNFGCKLWGRDSPLGRTGIFHGNWTLILALGVIGTTYLSFVVDVIE